MFPTSCMALVHRANASPVLPVLLRSAFYMLSAMQLFGMISPCLPLWVFFDRVQIVSSFLFIFTIGRDAK